ncbi:glycosyltransferase family 4 protein [Jiella sp. M17.18]|uniref:glycosyltransferase family 4 protein n=1 Tax=Jiella sp. M17.18 TaxID=3234247 RepID=UPI0034DEF016
MSDAPPRRLTFAIPGRLDTPSGGYGYDRRMIAELEALGWEVRHLGLPPGFPEPDGRAMATAAAEFSNLADGELVLVDGLAFGVLPEIARHEAKRLRLVALVHHPLALETGLSPAAQKHFAASERAALHAARAVVVTSPATAATLTADYDVAPEKLSVAVPGVDPVPDDEAAKGEGDPPVILSVGSLIPRKDHATLIEALAAIRNLPWRARIAGSDALDAATAAALKRQIAERGLEERVTLVGVLADVAPEYRGADVFALASRYEGYGMVFAEAMAHGLPIVSCAEGAPADLVPAEAGARFAAGDAAGLADALRALLADPGRRKAAAAAARAAGGRLPSWPDSARVLSDALERVAP